MSFIENIFLSKHFMKIWVILLISVFIFFGIHYLVWDYPLERDVWGKLNRAQISAESEDMLRLVDDAIFGLEKRQGLFSGNSQTFGNCALIFKTPDNSLKYQYEILKNIRTRLERTSTFDKNSPEYNIAIDDLRGQLRELEYLDCWIWHWG